MLFYEPDTESEAKRMQQRARNYKIIKGTLYKSGVCTPLLKCISQAEGAELLGKIHEGVCGAHIGSRPLAAKAVRQGFYWSSMIKDATEVVTRCEACQKISNKQSAPLQPT